MSLSAIIVSIGTVLETVLNKTEPVWSSVFLQMLKIPSFHLLGYVTMLYLFFYLLLLSGLRTKLENCVVFEANLNTWMYFYARSKNSKFLTPMCKFFVNLDAVWRVFESFKIFVSSAFSILDMDSLPSLKSCRSSFQSHDFYII